MIDPVPYYVFVYGSLRSDAGNAAHSYMQKYFRLVGRAKVRGRLYDLGSYTAATPSDAELFITGELYEIIDSALLTEALAVLDSYEEVGAAPGAGLYRRDLTNAFQGTNQTRAWIYWYNGDLTGRTLIPSGDIMNR